MRTVILAIALLLFGSIVVGSGMELPEMPEMPETQDNSDNIQVREVSVEVYQGYPGESSLDAALRVFREVFLGIRPVRYYL